MSFAAGHDCIETLPRLLGQWVSSFSAFAIMRAGVDVLSRAWYLYDPVIDVRGRIARGMSEAVHGDREMVKLGVSSGQYAREIVATAEQLGFAVKRSGPAVISIGAARPSSTELMQSMLGGSATPKTGERVWRLLSGMHHGSAHGLYLLFEPVSSRSSESGLALLRFRSSLLPPLVAAFLMSFLLTAERKAEFFGWQPTPWSQWPEDPFRIMERALAMDAPR
jgi:hypothetical protein